MTLVRSGGGTAERLNRQPTSDTLEIVAATRPAPTRADLDAWFTALIVGVRTSDEADKWASQWFDTAVDDDVVRWALGLLHGLDRHDDDQVRRWRAEFRTRCGMPETP